MCNGSTLDLSAIAGSFDLANAVANTSAAVANGLVGDMTYADGYRIVPDAGGLQLTCIMGLMILVR